MKRDWDVMRDVLLEVEALTPTQTQTFQFKEIPGSDEEGSVRARHAFMLFERQYLKGIYGETMSDGNYLLSPELTMDGADLLDTLRSKSLWEQTKKIAKEKGIEITFDTLKTLAKTAMGQLLS